MEEKVFVFKPDDMTICLSDCISPLTAIEAEVRADQVQFNFFYSLAGTSTSRTFSDEDVSTLRYAFGLYLASMDGDDLKKKKSDSRYRTKPKKKSIFFKEDLGADYVQVQLGNDLFLVTKNTEIKRLYKFMVKVEKAVRSTTVKPQHTRTA